ncbi:MAG: hypothetical protein GY792_06440 [Gammaproteobacteria bacterium]|nr:hypothetical protein [Gammaproteobacteria bacterium]MCP4980327.1 hypothetical protein [Gammaproteobacteria bacterium]
MMVTPHVAQNDTHHSSAIDGRTTRHTGCTTSQTIRKLIEECFGWAKTIGGLRKSRFIGCEKLDFQFVLTFAAYNLNSDAQSEGGIVLTIHMLRDWSIWQTECWLDSLQYGC